MDLKGVAYDCKSEDVRVTVGAGVALDTLIDEVVERGMWGLENLSAIPGSVGAVPVQNVGAYGVEASDVIHEVYAYDCSTHEEVVLTRDACRFGYRDSLFKQNEGKRYIITAVVFRLSRIPSPHLGYKDLAVRFPTGDMPTLSTIRDAVIEIRKEKFPDWHTVGTAGSFFKNPVITRAHYAELCERYPELPGFPYAGGIKIPLGWILDRVLNLRGYREGSVGLYEKQALVLVHHGGGTANEIYAFSERIITRVYEATGVQVEREVVCV
jgi:UDP-N-acetylmuramate dehydrogenase